MATSHPRDDLEFFCGTWTVKGQEKTYSEVCDWLPGRGFVACNAVDRSESSVSFSMSVFGYADTDGQYTYNGFSNVGTQRVLRGNFDNGIWRFHGQSDRAPNWRRWQVTITPTSTGFLFREEVSDRSGPWRESVALEYLRVADARRYGLMNCSNQRAQNRFIGLPNVRFGVAWPGDLPREGATHVHKGNRHQPVSARRDPSQKPS